MNVKRLFILTTVLLASLFLARGVQAMSSTNYRLDWFTQLNSGGGGTASSTNYAVNYTIGQSTVGAASSPNYQVALGYWHGADVCWHCIFLPLIKR